MVSRIILDIVQLKLISIYPDSSLRIPVPFTNFIYKTHFDVNSCGNKSCFTIEISLKSAGRFA